MGMVPFLLLTMVGTAVWDAALIGIGAAAGSSWQMAAGRFHYQSAVVMMVLFSVAVTLLPLVLLRRRKNRPNAKSRLFGEIAAEGGRA